jgi:hypothetical protein
MATLGELEPPTCSLGGKVLHPVELRIKLFSLPFSGGCHAAVLRFSDP